MKTLKILADENIPGLHHYFDAGLQQILAHDLAHNEALAHKSVPDITIHTLPGREIKPCHLSGVNMLLVRSITAVSAELISAAELGFVGSCTIGTDHLDIDALEQAGITWVNAPGCNANAVAEYVLQHIMRFAAETDRPLNTLTLGVLGYGNVGRKVADKMLSFGVKQVSINDPLLEDVQMPAGTQAVDLAALFACDIVTVHVPWTKGGAYPTHHLIDPSLLTLMPSESLLLNTARGPVIDLQACRQWRARLTPAEQAARRWVFDVFEGEPHVDPACFEHLMATTPHIAGHSQIGKEQGTRQVWQAALAHLHAGYDLAQEGGALAQLLADFPLSAPLPTLDLLIRQSALSAADWHQLLDTVSGLEATDQHLRSTMAQASRDQWGAAFEGCRKAYQPRMEMSQLRLAAPNLNHEDNKRLTDLGAKVDQ